MPLSDDQTRLLPEILTELAPYQFAFGGAGAMIDHGAIIRETTDLDFATIDDFNIGELVEWLGDLLNVRGHRVETRRISPSFAELSVDGIEMDFVRDWRKHPPDQMPYGPRVHIEDLIASKLSAATSRQENRDIIDLAQLTNNWSMTDLVALAKDRDPGFSVRYGLEIIEHHRYRASAGFSQTMFERSKAHVIAELQPAMRLEAQQHQRRANPPDTDFGIDR